MLLAVHQFAAGLPQGSLQLVDAGLVLQQHVLRFIQELEEQNEAQTESCKLLLLLCRAEM